MNENEVQLVEQTELKEAVLNDNILKDVLILGAKSANKRVYTSDAMRNAIPLYENACVYINHSNGERKLEDRFGTAKNVRLTENGLISDIEVLITHPMFAVVKEAYDLKTAKIGCSHDAVGSGVVGTDGITTINQIIKVKSVDLVSGAATTRNLRESEDLELISLKEENITLKETVENLTKEVESLKATQNKWKAPVALPIVEQIKEEIPKEISALAKWLRT